MRLCCGRPAAAGAVPALSDSAAIIPTTAASSERCQHSLLAAVVSSGSATVGTGGDAFARRPGARKNTSTMAIFLAKRAVCAISALAGGG